MPTIFVPTRGRLDRQVTLRSLKPEIAGWKVRIIVPECELKDWKNSEYPIITVPDHFNFSQIRQFILEKSTEKYHIVADDDLRFFRRLVSPEIMNASGLVSINDITPALDRITDLLDRGYAHGGISERLRNNFRPEDTAYVFRCTRFHFYNREIVIKQPFRFDDVVTKQDYHSILSMFELGFKNAVIFNYAHEQLGNNTRGGCSRYRTQAVMEQGAIDLQALHPEFSKVIEKDVKWRGVEGKLKDIRIQWKKSLGSRSNERVD